MKAPEFTSEKTKRNLEEVNFNLLQFCYSISHNFKSSIARLLSLSELIVIETDINKIKAFTELLRKVTKDMDSIVTDMSYDLEQAKTHKIEREEISIGETWQRVLTILDHELPTEYLISIDLSEANCVHSSISFLHSILFNLASNSIKYRSPDRPLKIWLSSHIMKSNGGVILKFKDNGIGIDLRQYQDELFGLKKRFSDQGKGEGVGLYLVKSQIESLGGSISVESKLDEGTTFTLYFKDANCEAFIYPTNVLVNNTD